MRGQVSLPPGKRHKGAHSVGTRAEKVISIAGGHAGVDAQGHTAVLELRYGSLHAHHDVAQALGASRTCERLLRAISEWRVEVVNVRLGSRPDPLNLGLANRFDGRRIKRERDGDIEPIGQAVSEKRRPLPELHIEGVHGRDHVLDVIRLAGRLVLKDRGDAFQVDPIQLVKAEILVAEADEKLVLAQRFSALGVDRAEALRTLRVNAQALIKAEDKA